MIKLKFSPVFLYAFAPLILGVCTVSENPLVRPSAHNITAVVDVTHTPLPKSANIAEQNFRRDWEAGFERSKAELIRKRESWIARHITDYDFVIAMYMGGVSSPWNRSPVRIEVRQGVVQSTGVVDKSDLSQLARTDGFNEFDTVVKVFDYLLAQLESGYIIGIEYDRRLGYPIRASVMFTYASNHNVRSIVISKLSPVKKQK
ncbi:MAG: DUF6174 domain-containing protein [Pyrinomonadaceae bacterium]